MRRVRRLEEARHLVDAEVFRDAALEARRRHQRRRIALDQPLAPQVAREGPDRRDLARHRGPGDAARVQLGEEAAQAGQRHVLGPEVGAAPARAGRDVGEELRQVAVVGADGVRRDGAVQRQEVEEAGELRLERRRDLVVVVAGRPAAGAGATGGGHARAPSRAPPTRRARRARARRRPRAGSRRDPRARAPRAPACDPPWRAAGDRAAA